MSGRKRRRSSPLRLVLDTNTWVSLLLKREFLPLLGHLFRERLIRLVVSADLQAEIREVAARHKFRSYFPYDDLPVLWRSLSAIKALERVAVHSKLIGLCPDPKDDFLLNLCLDARPDVLVSGDFLVREAAARPAFQPLSIWSLTELRAYAAQAAG